MRERGVARYFSMEFFVKPQLFSKTPPLAREHEHSLVRLISIFIKTRPIIIWINIGHSRRTERQLKLSGKLTT